MDKIGQLPFLEGEIFESVKPGLSAFADQPKQVSDMIDSFVSVLYMLRRKPRVSALSKKPFTLYLGQHLTKLTQLTLNTLSGIRRP